MNQTADQRIARNFVTSLKHDYTPEQNTEIEALVKEVMEMTRKETAGQLAEAKEQLVKAKTGK